MTFDFHFDLPHDQSWLGLTRTCACHLAGLFQILTPYYFPPALIDLLSPSSIHHHRLQRSCRCDHCPLMVVLAHYSDLSADFVVDFCPCFLMLMSSLSAVAMVPPMWKPLLMFVLVIDHLLKK